MRRPDARSAQIDRPAGVTRTFQVSVNKVEPSKSVLGRNLFAKDGLRFVSNVRTSDRPIYLRAAKDKNLEARIGPSSPAYPDYDSLWLPEGDLTAFWNRVEALRKWRDGDGKL